MKKVFYEKVGRKYVPVAEYDNDWMDSFPKGNHLIMCYPGGQSRRFRIDPNHAAMIAAGRVAEDAIANAIVKAQHLKPQREPLTETQRGLWRALAHSFNSKELHLMRPSAREAAEAGVNAMIEEADKLMANPVIKKAFEKFIMLCELTKDHEVKDQKN